MKNLIQKKFRNDLRRILPVLVGVGLLASVAAPAFAIPTQASLTLGDSRPEQETTYRIGLSTVDDTSARCITVDLEAGAAGDADLDSSTLITTGSWTDASTASQLRITSAGEVPSASGHITWSGVVNGDTADTAYEATYTSYENANCSDDQIETVTVQYIYTAGQQVSASVDPTFTFTVAGLADEVIVNGAETTIDASGTPNQIPFGTVTASENQIVGQSLTINTNAQNGYNIYAQYTNALRKADLSHSINDVTAGTFPGAGDENFGFTSADGTVEEGLFDGGDFAPITTSQQAVAAGTEATGGTESTNVAYQLGVSLTTPSGSYTTTVIYTAVPTF